MATEPVLECNLTSSESWHRITCGHNRVAIVSIFRQEQVVHVASNTPLGLLVKKVKKSVSGISQQTEEGSHHVAHFF